MALMCMIDFHDKLSVFLSGKSRMLRVGKAKGVYERFCNVFFEWFVKALHVLMTFIMMYKGIKGNINPQHAKPYQK